MDSAILSPFVGTPVALLLYISGCVVGGSWYPVVSVLPSLASIACGLMFSHTSDDTKPISSDTWLFMLIGCLATMTALPTVFYHLEKLNAAALALQMSGDLCTFFTVVIFITLSKRK